MICITNILGVAITGTIEKKTQLFSGNATYLTVAVAQKKFARYLNMDTVFNTFGYLALHFYNKSAEMKYPRPHPFFELLMSHSTRIIKRTQAKYV